MAVDLRQRVFTPQGGGETHKHGHGTCSHNTVGWTLVREPGSSKLPLTSQWPSPALLKVTIFIHKTMPRSGLASTSFVQWLMILLEHQSCPHVFRKFKAGLRYGPSSSNLPRHKRKHHMLSSVYPSTIMCPLAQQKWSYFSVSQTIRTAIESCVFQPRWPKVAGQHHILEVICQETRGWKSASISLHVLGATISYGLWSPGGN